MDDEQSIVLRHTVGAISKDFCDFQHSDLWTLTWTLQHPQSSSNTRDATMEQGFEWAISCVNALSQETLLASHLLIEIPLPPLPSASLDPLYQWADSVASDAILLISPQESIHRDNYNYNYKHNHNHNYNHNHDINHQYSSNKNNSFIANMRGRLCRRASVFGLRGGGAVCSNPKRNLVQAPVAIQLSRPASRYTEPQTAVSEAKQLHAPLLLPKSNPTYASDNAPQEESAQNDSETDKKAPNHESSIHPKPHQKKEEPEPPAGHSNDEKASEAQPLESTVSEKKPVSESDASNAVLSSTQKMQQTQGKLDRLFHENPPFIAPTPTRVDQSCRDLSIRILRSHQSQRTLPLLSHLNQSSSPLESSFSTSPSNASLFTPMETNENAPTLPPTLNPAPEQSLRNRNQVAPTTQTQTQTQTGDVSAIVQAKRVFDAFLSRNPKTKDDYDEVSTLAIANQPEITRGLLRWMLMSPDTSFGIVATEPGNELSRTFKGSDTRIDLDMNIDDDFEADIEIAWKIKAAGYIMWYSAPEYIDEKFWVAAFQLLQKNFHLLYRKLGTPEDRSLFVRGAARVLMTLYSSAFPTTWQQKSGPDSLSANTEHLTQMLDALSRDRTQPEIYVWASAAKDTLMRIMAELHQPRSNGPISIQVGQHTQGMQNQQTPSNTYSRSKLDSSLDSNPDIGMGAAMGVGSMHRPIASISAVSMDSTAHLVPHMGLALAGRMPTFSTIKTPQVSTATAFAPLESANKATRNTLGSALQSVTPLSLGLSPLELPLPPETSTELMNSYNQYTERARYMNDASASNAPSNAFSNVSVQPRMAQINENGSLKTAIYWLDQILMVYALIQCNLFRELEEFLERADTNKRSQPFACHVALALCEVAVHHDDPLTRISCIRLLGEMYMDPNDEWNSQILFKELLFIRLIRLARSADPIVHFNARTQLHTIHSRMSSHTRTRDLFDKHLDGRLDELLPLTAMNLPTNPNTDTSNKLPISQGPAMVGAYQLYNPARAEGFFPTSLFRTALSSNSSIPDILQLIQTSVLHSSQLRDRLQSYLPPVCLIQPDAASQPEPSSGISSDPHTYADARVCVQNFLQNQTHRTLVVLGQPGVGKSSFLLYLLRELWASWTDEKPIPLYIPLQTLSRPDTHAIDEALTSAFKNGIPPLQRHVLSFLYPHLYTQSPQSAPSASQEYSLAFTEEQAERIRRERDFIFLFDGYDEICGNISTVHSAMSNIMHSIHTAVTNPARKASIKNINLYVSNRMQLWKAKCIFTCSTISHVPNLSLLKLFAPYSNGSPSFQSLQSIYLMHFEDPQITKYLSDYSQLNPRDEYESPDTYWKYLNKIPLMKKYSRFPFDLFVFTSSLPHVLLKSRILHDNPYPNLCRSDFYDSFTQSWYEEYEEKLLQNPNSNYPTNLMNRLDQYHKLLATMCYLKGTNCIPIDSSILCLQKKKSDLQKTFKKRNVNLTSSMNPSLAASPAILQLIYNASAGSSFSIKRGNMHPLPSNLEESLNMNPSSMEDFDSFFSEAEPIRTLSQGAMVRRIGQFHYEFIHLSIRDYFFAKNIYDSIMGKTGSALDILMSDYNMAALDSEMVAQLDKQTINAKEYLASPLSKTIIAFLADRAKNDSTFCAKLYEYIDRSRKLVELSALASNCITILNFANMSFSSKNLHGIAIPYADLSGAILDNVDFSEADLRGVQMTDSYVRDCNFTNTLMDKIEFGKYPFFPHNEEIECMGYWLNNGLSYLVSSSGGNIYIWDLQLFQLFQIIPVQLEKVSCMDILSPVQESSSTGSIPMCVVGTAQGIISIWNLINGDLVREWNGHNCRITSVRFIEPTSPSSYFVTTDENGSIIMWDKSKGTHIWKIENAHAKRITDIDIYLPASGLPLLVSTGLDLCICFWDIVRGSLYKSIRGVSSAPLSVMHIPQSEKEPWLVVGCRDGKIRVFDWVTGLLLGEWESGSSHVIQLCWWKDPFSDDILVASSQMDFCIHVWNWKAKSLIRTYEGHQNIVTGLLPIVPQKGNPILASSSKDCTAQLWKVEYLSISIPPQLNARPSKYVACIEICTLVNDVVVVACGDDQGMITIYELSTGRELQKLIGHIGPVRSILRVVSSYSDYALASAGDDGKIIVWDLQTEHEDRLQNSVLVSKIAKTLPRLVSDNTKLNQGSEVSQGNVHSTSSEQNENIQIIDKDLESSLINPMANKKRGIEPEKKEEVYKSPILQQVGRIIQQITTKAAIYCTCVINQSPSVRYLVTGGSDCLVRVWDMDTLDLVMELEGHTGVIESLQGTRVSEDKFLLVSAGSSGAVLVWETKDWELVESYKGHENPVHGLCIVSTAVSARLKEQNLADSHDGSSEDEDNLETDIKKGSTGELKSEQDGNMLPVNRKNSLQAAIDESKLSLPKHSVLTCSEDGQIRLWSLSTFRDWKILAGHYQGTFSVCGYYPKLKSSQTAAKLASISDDEENPSVKNKKASDGFDWEWVLSGGGDGMIRVWNVKYNQEGKWIRAHNGSVLCLYVSEDGRYVVSGGSDGALKVWKVKFSKESTLLHGFQYSAYGNMPDNQTDDGTHYPNTINESQEESGGDDERELNQQRSRNNEADEGAASRRSGNTESKSALSRRGGDKDASSYQNISKPDNDRGNREQEYGRRRHTQDGLKPKADNGQRLQLELELVWTSRDILIVEGSLTVGAKGLTSANGHLLEQSTYVAKIIRQPQVVARISMEAKCGCPHALTTLGILHWRGDINGSLPNPVAAVPYFFAAAQLDNPEAMVYLAKFILHNQSAQLSNTTIVPGTNKSPMRILIDPGTPRAQVDMTTSMSSSTSNGTHNSNFPNSVVSVESMLASEPRARAMYWLRRAAAVHRNPEAMVLLGLCIESYGDEDSSQTQNAAHFQSQSMDGTGKSSKFSHLINHAHGSQSSLGIISRKESTSVDTSGIKSQSNASSNTNSSGDIESELEDLSFIPSNVAQALEVNANEPITDQIAESTVSSATNMNSSRLAVQNTKKQFLAFDWYRKTAELGHAHGCFKLGYAFWSGTGVLNNRKDFEQSVNWYVRAASQGHSMAQYNLACAIRDGIPVSASQASTAIGRSEVIKTNGSEATPEKSGNATPRHAIQLLVKSSQKGNPYALSTLGRCYESGWGVAADYDVAVRYYQRALQYSISSINLSGSTSLWMGSGVGGDTASGKMVLFISERLKLLKLQEGDLLFVGGSVDFIQSELLRPEHAIALYNLGLCYKTGRGVEKDIHSSAQCLSYAGVFMHPDALFNLAIYHQNGLLDSTEATSQQPTVQPSEVNRRGNTERALRLFRASAQLGNVPAISNIGVFFENGWVVKKDFEKAAKYYRAAADRGSAPGMCNLADLLEYGRGIRRDLEEAKRLYSRAARLGNPVAVRALKRIGMIS